MCWEDGIQTLCPALSTLVLKVPTHLPLVHPKPLSFIGSKRSPSSWVPGEQRTADLPSGWAQWRSRLMGALHNMAQAALRLLQPLILTLGLSRGEFTGRSSQGHGTEGAKRRPPMYHEGAWPRGDPLHLEPPHSVKIKQCGKYLFTEKKQGCRSGPLQSLRRIG